MVRKCPCTGTVKGDAIEGEVIQRVWRGNRLPVTSVKGHVGHLMGASGLFNALVAYESSKSGRVPPICRHDGGMLNVDFFVTQSAAALVPGGPVICFSIGFGGNNVALILGRE